MASVKADRVLDNWVTIVENGAGFGHEVYVSLDAQLKDADLPFVSWKLGNLNTGIMTKSREFFILTHDNLKEYTIYVFARDIGKHLDCGWFLTVEPGMFKKSWLFAMFEASIYD